ncbi:glycosyltransferase family 2 protein [Halobacteriales archaeon QS_3_64_16]|nr:MAG: glycosyltransferase family 2 protein [Halobacteriales archaeon QS_3_64_16]
MYEGKTIGVVVPAYNEAGLVGGVIETMPAFVDRVYVVDDSSTDDTWAEVTRHTAAINERRNTESPLTNGGTSEFVVPIRHEENRGPGGARKTGYARALADEIDVVATMDADGQMDPAYLDRIVAPVASGRVAYAKGTRLGSREFWREMPPFRLFGNLLLTFLTKVASGYWGMTDPQNGYTAISKNALVDIGIETLYDDYGYLNDVLTSLNVDSRLIADVSHPARYGTEHSGIRYSTFVPSLSGVLLRNFCRRLTDRYLMLDFHPLAFLYGLGALGLAGSALSAGSAVYAALSPGSTSEPSSSPSPVSSTRRSATDGGSTAETDPSSSFDSGSGPESTAESASSSESTARPSAPRSTVARSLVALEAFVFGACVLALAIAFDVRANEGLVVRVEDGVADGRSSDSRTDRPADRADGEGTDGTEGTAGAGER